MAKRNHKGENISTCVMWIPLHAVLNFDTITYFLKSFYSHFFLTPIKSENNVCDAFPKLISCKLVSLIILLNILYSFQEGSGMES